MNKNQLNKEEYLIEITKSPPQIIDSKKSHYLFDKKTFCKSPKRDAKKEIFKIPSFKLGEDKSDPIKDKLEQKITENIMKREGFESLFDDPDINKFINK